MKNRKKKLRNITVDGKEYKWIASNSSGHFYDCDDQPARKLTVYDGKNILLEREYNIRDILPRIVEEAIRGHLEDNRQG